MTVHPRFLLCAAVAGATLALSACTGADEPAARPVPAAPAPDAAGRTLAPQDGQAARLPEPAPVLTPGGTPGTVAAQPTTRPLTELAQTDLGQYLVRPTVGEAQVRATVRELQGLPGVQSATVNAERLVDLVFLGSSTPEQRSVALERLSTLGEVLEGV